MGYFAWARLIEDTTEFMRMEKIFEFWMSELLFLLTTFFPMCWDEDGDSDCCASMPITPAYTEATFDEAYMMFGGVLSCVWCAEACDEDDEAPLAWCCIFPCMVAAVVGTYALRVAINMTWVLLIATLLMLEGLGVCLVAMFGSFLLLLDDDEDDGCCAGEETWCFCLECCEGCDDCCFDEDAAAAYTKDADEMGSIVHTHRAGNKADTLDLDSSELDDMMKRIREAETEEELNMILKEIEEGEEPQVQTFDSEVRKRCGACLALKPRDMFSKTQLTKGARKRCKVCVSYDTPVKSISEIDAAERLSTAKETPDREFSGFEDDGDNDESVFDDGGGGVAAASASGGAEVFDGFEEKQPDVQPTPSADGYLEVTGTEREAKKEARSPSPVVVEQPRKSAAAAPAAAAAPVPIVRTKSKPVPPIGGLKTKTPMPMHDPDEFPQVLVSFFPDAFNSDEVGTAFANALVNGLIEESNGSLTCFHRRMAEDKFQENDKDWISEWGTLIPQAKVIVVMLSHAYLKDKTCLKELKAACKQRQYNEELTIIPIHLEKGIKTQGKFLGRRTPQLIKDANIISSQLGNTHPSPEKGLFQGKTEKLELSLWKQNLADLAAQIAGFMSGGDGEAKCQYTNAGRACSKFATEGSRFCTAHTCQICLLSGTVTPKSSKAEACRACVEAGAKVYEALPDMAASRARKHSITWSPEHVVTGLEQLNTQPFKRRTRMPEVIISYQTNSVGEGLGQGYCYALANELDAAGINCFHGKMVAAGEDWKEEWFGVLPEAAVVLVMLSKSFLKSPACREELLASCKLRMDKMVGLCAIYLESVDKELAGHFMGNGTKALKAANLIRNVLKDAASLPASPDDGFFQGLSAHELDLVSWKQNVAQLILRLKQRLKAKNVCRYKNAQGRACKTAQMANSPYCSAHTCHTCIDQRLDNNDDPEPKSSRDDSCVKCRGRGKGEEQLYGATYEAPSRALRTH